MATWVEKLRNKTDSILDTTWDKRQGQVVPTSDNVALKDGAVELEATFLYADLAASSEIARLCPWPTTAKIIRAYLACATMLIRAYDGEIRSFDGDRVMGIFIGDSKNTNAVKCSREIFWTVDKVIGPRATNKFKSIKNNNIKIKNGLGVDTGTSQSVRAGIRDNNDLIWVGAAPSFAAKLSDIREYPYCVMISKEVFNRMSKSERTEGDIKIWENRKYKGRSIYRTKWLRTP